MKNFIMILLLFTHSIVVFGQEQENNDILLSDWGKEIFKFPIRFAQEINYKGIEEARFPKGWGKIESPEFWSYIFAWHIDLDKELTAKDLETNLQYYFDGLMNVKFKKWPKTIAKFQSTVSENEQITFKGILNTFDNFKTKKQLLLNVTVEQYFCSETQKSVVIFRFSPKGFDNDIWAVLNKIKLNTEVCDF